MDLHMHIELLGHQLWRASWMGYREAGSPDEIPSVYFAMYDSYSA